MKPIIKETKIGIIVTLVLLTIITISYFRFAPKMMDLDPAFFIEAKGKAAFAPTGELKLFVTSSNKAMERLRISEGGPITKSLVIGSAEAKMMREENLFQSTGDELLDLFGTDFIVEGVLSETGSIIDDSHVVTLDTFEQIDGEQVVYFKMLGNEPKSFYYFPIGANWTFKAELAEGDIDRYKMSYFKDQQYYPVILGSREAEMMREENLFQNAGDKIDGFFGVDIRIAGILKPTGTGLDMIHLISLQQEELT